MDQVMNDVEATADEASRFSALLTPHRSLSPQGFTTLMAAIGGVSVATGIAFLMVGAWPVLGFLGLDVLLIYLAFKLNYHAARTYETVDLSETSLHVRRVHASGKEESWEFNPYWVRLMLEADESGDHSELKLRSHGRELELGSFLSEEERRDFAQALAGALAGARAGTAA